MGAVPSHRAPSDGQRISTERPAFAAQRSCLVPKPRDVCVTRQSAPLARPSTRLRHLHLHLLWFAQAFIGSPVRRRQAAGQAVSADLNSSPALSAFRSTGPSQCRRAPSEPVVRHQGAADPTRMISAPAATATSRERRIHASKPPTRMAKANTGPGAFGVRRHCASLAQPPGGLTTTGARRLKGWLCVGSCWLFLPERSRRVLVGPLPSPSR